MICHAVLWAKKCVQKSVQFVQGMHARAFGCNAQLCARDWNAKKKMGWTSLENRRWQGQTGTEWVDDVGGPTAREAPTGEDEACFSFPE